MFTEYQRLVYTEAKYRGSYKRFITLGFRTYTYGLCLVRRLAPSRILQQLDVHIRLRDLNKAHHGPPNEAASDRELQDNVNDYHVSPKKNNCKPM